MVDRDRAVGHGGHHLPDLLGPHITHSVDTGEAGPGGFPGNDIAIFVQFQLSPNQVRGRLAADANEQTIAGDFRFLVGKQIPHRHGCDTISYQTVNDTVPAKFHIVGLHQGLVVDLCCPQGIPPMDQDYFLRHPAQGQSIRRGGIAAAYHHNGLALPTWAFPTGLGFLNGPAAEGNETCSYIIDEATGLYVWPAATEAYKAAVVETYDWYQKGLIDPDNISFTGTEADDKFKAGLTFAAYSATGSANSWSTDMIRDGIIADRDALRPAVVYGMDGKWYMTQTEDYWTVTSFNHKIEDVKKERALMFWEYLHTDEGILLRWLGVPGKDYNKTGDGLRDVEILWEYDEATGTYISPYVNDSFNEANGACNGKPGNPAEIAYQEELKQIVWDKMAEGKATIKPVDYQMAVFQGENKSKYGTFGADAKEAWTVILATPNCDPAAEWDKFVETMMPRVQPVLDELNTGILGK